MKYLLSWRAFDLLFEPRDAWIGVYWAVDKEVDYFSLFPTCYRRYLRVYVCLLPFLPLRLTLRLRDGVSA